MGGPATASAEHAPSPLESFGRRQSAVAVAAGVATVE